MTTYFKSLESGYNFICVNWKATKVPKSHLFCTGVPKCVTSWVIKPNLFRQYVIDDTGITQKPHEHLFQKLGKLGTTLYIGQKATNHPNQIFVVTREPKYVTTWVIYDNLFMKYVIYDSGIIQLPLDNLF